MPDYKELLAGRGSTPSPGGSNTDAVLSKYQGGAAPAEEESGGMNPLYALLGVGAAAAAAKYGLKPGVMGKAAGAANNLRMTSMLSGLASAKSALGNVGAAANTAMEGRTMKPLTELFSRTTLDDFVRELKAPTQNYAAAGEEAAGTMASSSAWNPFGRVMNAGDTATRGALERAGSSAKEAERQVLQTPLPKPIAEALDNPVMRWLIPFRRTPINQALEGGKSLGELATRPETRLPFGVHTAAGAALGAESSDEQFPTEPVIYSAFAGRYGAPALMAALAARKLAGGKSGGGLAGAALPTSEFGIERSMDPTHALDFLDPTQSAAYRALDRYTR